MGEIVRNDLSWIAKAVDNNGNRIDGAGGWVTISPSQGAGDSNINIEVKNSDRRADSVEGFVEIKCTSCKTLEGDDIIKKIKVCRCACDCENWTFNQVVDTVKDEGLAAGTTIATFQKKKLDCNSNLMSATIRKEGEETGTALKIENQSIKLNYNINANKELHTVNYIVDLKFDGGDDGNTCPEYTITQDALVCDCKKVFDEAEIKNSLCISTFGVKKGGTIGTYTVKEGNCPIDYAKATLVPIYPGGSTYNLRLIDGEIKLPASRNILPNDERGAKIFKFTLMYGQDANNKETCFEKEIVQPGVDCNCDDVKFVFKSSALVKIDEETYQIPQSGLTANTLIGNYSFVQGASCKDCDDCIQVLVKKIEPDGTETELSNLKLLNGEMRLTQDIGENENLSPITYVFSPRYNLSKTSRNCDINGDLALDWQDCTPIEITQKELGCECKNIEVTRISSNLDPVTLPTVGTHGDFVAVAKATAGIFGTNGQLIKSCGKLFGYQQSTLTIRPTEEEIEQYNGFVYEEHEGEQKNSILSVPTGQTDSEGNYATYYFYAKVGSHPEIDSPFGFAGNVYLLADGSTEALKCSGKDFEIVIDPDACDCIIPDKVNNKTNPIIDKVPCTGTTIPSQTVRNPKCIMEFRGIHKNMILLITKYTHPEGAEDLITNITVGDKTSNGEMYGTYPKNYAVKIYGNVGEGSPTEERKLGTIEVTPVCNPEYDSEGHYIAGTGWICEPKEYEIIQEKCPNCDCDEIKTKLTIEKEDEEYQYNRLLISYNKPLNEQFEHDENNKRYKIAINTGITNCPVIKIDGQVLDEDGVEWKYVTYKDEWGEDKNWFKVRVEKELDYWSGGEVFYLVFYMYTHRNTIKFDEYEPYPDPPMLKFIVGYYEKESGNWNECQDLSFERKIYDTACVCNLLKDPYFNSGYFTDTYTDYYKYYLNPNSNKFTIKLGENDTTKQVELFNDNLKGCIDLIIKIKGESEGEYTESTEYTYIKDGANLFKIEIIYENKVKITLFSILQQEYRITLDSIGAVIVPRHKNENGEYENCDPLDVIVQQDACNCSRLDKYSLCSYEHTFNIDIDINDTTGKTDVFKYYSALKGCISIYILNGETKIYPGQSFDYLDENNQRLFTVTLEDSSTVKITLDNKDIILPTSGIELHGGFYYGESGNEETECCTFKINVNKSNCNCDDFFKDIKNKNKTLYINETGCNDDHYIEISAPPCDLIQLYLSCDENTDEGCHCSDIDIDGNGTVDSNEEYVCLFTENSQFPPKYDFVHSLPGATGDSQQIVFNDLPDGVASRTAHFYAFWAENVINSQGIEEVKLVRIDKNGNKVSEGGVGYCGIDFTVTQELHKDCDCFKQTGGINTSINFNEEKVRIISGEDGNRYHVNETTEAITFGYVEVPYNAKECVKVIVSGDTGTQPVINNISVSTYCTPIEDGTGKCRFELKASFVRNIQESEQSATMNIYIRYKDGDLITNDKFIFVVNGSN